MYLVKFILDNFGIGRIRREVAVLVLRVIGERKKL
jgi:hypothetical protein